MEEVSALFANLFWGVEFIQTLSPSHHNLLAAENIYLKRPLTFYMFKLYVLVDSTSGLPIFEVSSVGEEEIILFS